MTQLTITRPDDWHLHVRDGAAMAAVLPWSARQFARAIVMPNLRPPVTTTALALAYRERLLHSGFTPSALQSPRGGFTSGETQHPEQFCGPDGIVIVSEVDSSRASRSVLVTLLSQAAASLGGRHRRSGPQTSVRKSRDPV